MVARELGGAAKAIAINLASQMLEPSFRTERSGEASAAGPIRGCAGERPVRSLACQMTCRSTCSPSWAV
jgi:hypothetical protein